MKYEELKEKYPVFKYTKYEIVEEEENLVLKFNYVIENLCEFNPKIKLNKKFITNKNINKDLLNYLVFNIGLIELVSYWKCTCSKNIIIEAGYVNQEQINWFKKLYYHGLGEFFYLNKIDVDLSDYVNITCTKEEQIINQTEFNGVGNLIPIGGGKDSVVSMEILKGMNNNTFMINPKPTMLECSKIGGYENPIVIERILDKQIIELNKQGYLNGHTPFSSLVAFITYFVSYLSEKKYIVLSNEGSANESNVVGTKVNHQYSKSFEFEQDFNNYVDKYFKLGIKYFSLLRPLHEIQIAQIFSKYPKYYNIFKSCNVGSKEPNWPWCCNCPKCLFVYIMMSPFIQKEKLIEIFKEDLYEKEELLSTFIELIGESIHKPFECVGTYDEIKTAISIVIKRNEKLPFLLNYYKEHYSLVDDSILNAFNNEHYLNEEFLERLKNNL